MGGDGKIEREIPVTAKEPSNLAFGGADGRTVYQLIQESAGARAALTAGAGR